MPYNPGVVDRSGEILAESRLAAGSSLLQGLTRGIETYVQKQEQRKKEEEATQVVSGIFKANPFLAKSLSLPVDASGQVDKGALKEFVKLSGGAPQAIQLASGLEQMARMREQQEQQAKVEQMKLAEMERQVAGREKLNKALTASPAQLAIDAGASFEKLPTGSGAFLSQAPRNTAEFIERAQRSGAPADLWLPLAIQRSQVEENVAQANERMARKPELGFATPEEALKKSSELAKQYPGMTPSFSVVQGRYYPIFREQEPGAFEKTTDKLAAESAQKRLDQFTSDYDNAVSGATSAKLVIEGLNSGQQTGVFTPFVNFTKRAFKAAGVDIDVAEAELLQKGLAGFQASQISVLARGLGAMSNADREFYVATAPNITDSTTANRFFAEMALENEKFAKQDRALVRQMQKEKVPTQEIVNTIEALRESRNVARDVYRRVVTKDTQFSENSLQFLTTTPAPTR
jgi:hypothetical protein